MSKKDELRRKRENLAKADFCRRFLHIQGFLSDQENEKVHNRIMKWQDKNKVAISEEQLLSVDISYDDDAKEE